MAAIDKRAESRGWVRVKIMIAINATNGSNVVNAAINNAGFWFQDDVILVLVVYDKILMVRQAR